MYVLFYLRLLVFSTTLTLPFLAAGDLVWTDPDGNTVLYNLGDIGFVLISMALVLIMIPGVGYFYSGLLRRKNALSMIFMSMLSVAVVSFQVRTILVRHLTLLNTFSGFSGATHLHSAIRPVRSSGT